MTRTLARRLAAVTAATAVALAPVVATPPALAAPASATTGLFGSADPTFDGAYRQTMAILGLVAAKAAVPASAVAWLTAQQCPDGSFQAYRSDLSAPCDPPDPQAFTGVDTNSTALAAMALGAVGRTAAAQRAVRAVLREQNADGGWGYTFASDSDTASTGLVMAALRSVPLTSTSRAALRTGERYLRSAQLPCTGSTRFALPYQPGGAPSALSSAQALVGLSGSLPVGIIARTPVTGITCSDALVPQVAAYLDRILRANRGALPSDLGDGTDWNATATAVIALAGAGAAPAGIRVGIDALGRNATAYVGTGSQASPAALGTLLQAAVVGGERPRAFGTGRTNLVATLLGTLRK